MRSNQGTEQILLLDKVSLTIALSGGYLGLAAGAPAFSLVK